ncbi:MAG TPA: hypothetical protein VKU01_21275 [Bryobacteraceae bacterium]|nr:hypothetical protein [Bryobacteraceae bacterium]
MKVRFFLLAFTIAACPLTAQQTPLNEQIEKIEAGLTQITGLKFTKPVPSATIDKAGLHKFLEERIHDEVKPEELHAQEVSLKMLGFIPADFDLHKATVDLLTEQAAAFYDYHKKKLFIIETGNKEADVSSDAGQMALAHELSHALADQNFHLDKYIREGLRSDDGSSARLAVMEGQASWLMSAYTSLQSTGTAEIPTGVLELMTRTIEAGAEQYPVFAKAPPYLRESLVFPYTQGLLFQNFLYQKQGKEGFSTPFRRPPDSTMQILHPEKYMEHVEAVIPKLPDFPDLKQTKSLAKGTLGEFDYDVLLKQYAGTEVADSLVSHLTGSAYEVREDKHDHKPTLVLAANWDTPENARKFFEQYRKVVAKKSKSAKFGPETGDQVTGSDKAGYFRIRLQGACLDSVEGSRSPLN